MGASQPFLYAAHQRDVRLPSTSFDPRAVTRASREPKPKPSRPTGPLVSFSQHPDTHEILQPRTYRYTALSPLSKALIKWLRRLQFSLRSLQLLGAAGVLVLFSLFRNVDTPTTWAVRIMQAVTILHCVYALVHLSRKVSARTPASSAAYQFFSITLDLLATVAYVIGVLVVHAKASGWSTILGNQGLINDFVPAVYYTMMGTSGLHFLTIPSSIWLGWTFRKVSLMPPDMSPLEDFSTARAFHKRSKSSTSTQYPFGEGPDKRPWSQSNSRRDSVQQSSRPNTIAFMDTRVKAGETIAGEITTVNLPDRQYQIPIGSPIQTSFEKESHRSRPRFSYKESYMEVPMAEPDGALSDHTPHHLDVKHTAKPNETWMLGDSSMTRMKQRAMVPGAGAGRRSHHARGSKSYAALTQQYDANGCSSDSDYEDENGMDHFIADSDEADSPFPKPLGSHPTSPERIIGDLDHGEASKFGTARYTEDSQLKAEQYLPRQRNSSIQTEEFFAVSYGEMRSGTPPVLVGNARKVSGNDFASRYSAVPHDRRNASKFPEEGYAGGRYT